MPNSKDLARNSYLLSRCNEYQLNPEKLTAKMYANPDEPLAGSFEHPLLESDKDDNILLYYMDLSGSIVSYQFSKSRDVKGHKGYARKRFKNPKDGVKYKPVRSGLGTRPYLTPNLVKAYQAKQVIETLVITEGELKALVADQHADLFVVGIQGITNIKYSKDDPMLYKEILDIIEVCKVQNLIFLTDADTLVINWDPLEEPEKDLYKRPNSFFKAIVGFRELTKDLPIDVYWAHILTEFNETAKGLDDLIAQNFDNVAEVRNDLLKHSGARKFFYKMNITQAATSQIRARFGIHDIEEFYQTYSKVIKDFPFVFKRIKYQCKNDKVQVIQSKEARQYVIIGTSIYKNTLKPVSVNGGEDYILEPELLPWKQWRVKHDHREMSATIMSQIPSYDGIVNFPDHHDYKETVHGWYNVYKQVNWQSSPGDISTWRKMMTHIFGDNDIEHKGKVYTGFDLGFDYLQILWTDPRHPLPILALVSKENSTGKSTFGKLIRRIFQQNARWLLASQLNKSFTSYFATALVGILDESKIEDKKVINYLKYLVTADKLPFEAKGKDTGEVESYIKLIFCTNDIHDFAVIDDEETRFWVRELKKIPEHMRDVDMLIKLEKEIPALLYFLETRELATPKEFRHHFHPDLIKTEALERVKKFSRSNLEKDLESWVMDEFAKYSVPKLKFTISEIMKGLRNFRYTRSQIQSVIIDRWKMKATNSTYKYYSIKYNPETEESRVSEEGRKGRHYTFKIEDYFMTNDLFQMLVPTQLEQILPPEIIAEHSKKLKKITAPTVDEDSDDVPF